MPSRSLVRGTYNIQVRIKAIASCVKIQLEEGRYSALGMNGPSVFYLSVSGPPPPPLRAGPPQGGKQKLNQKPTLSDTQIPQQNLWDGALV